MWKQFNFRKFPKGHSRKQRRVTAEQVREIRASEDTLVVQAERYKVSKTTIAAIRSRRLYKDVV